MSHLEHEGGDPPTPEQVAAATLEAQTKTVTEACELVEKTWQSLAVESVQSGRYLRSITHTVTVSGNIVTGTVGSTYMPVAEYLEQGTGIYHESYEGGAEPHDLIRPKQARVLRFEVGGKIVFAAFVRGIKAKHYARRAFETSQAPVNAIYERGADELVLRLETLAS